MAAPAPDQWKIQTAGVLQRSDREILKILTQSRRDVNAMLRDIAARPGLGSKIREQQLLLVKRELQAEMARVWKKIGDVTAARRLEAANRLIDLNKALDTFVLTAAGVDDGAGLAKRIADAEADRARTGIDRMYARITGSSYVPLSERVYTSSVRISSRISRAVDSALARGLSAREFAREIAASGLINPNTPGGTRYAALRLARTEINNAAHAVAIESQREKPWVTGQKWNLSRSHPKADDCDRLARGGKAGDGVYPRDSVPKKPHPQCFCYLTPQVVEEEEFLDSLVAGNYNSYLERFPKGRTLNPIPPVPVPTPTPTPAPAPSPPEPAPVPPAGPPSAEDIVAGMLKSGSSDPDILRRLDREFGISASDGFRMVQLARRGTTPPVSTIRLKAGIDRINQVLNATGRRLVANEMTEQGRLVPKSLLELDSVAEVDRAHMDRVFGHNSTAVAYYDNADQMRIIASAFDPAYHTVVDRALQTGWWSRYGRTGPAGTIAHEFGHHLDAIINRHLVQADIQSLWNQVADSLDLPRPIGTDRPTLDAWVATYKARVKIRISTYGASNSAELLAEVWAEYSTSGPNARDYIRAIGDRIRELAEKGARG